MRKELEETIRKENAKGTEIADLKQRLDELQNQNMMHYQQATSFNTIFERVETLTGRLEMLKKNRDRMKIGMTELKGGVDYEFGC
jgi:predicted RNase H-like nuclease (RuvC/YqgF family)